VPAQACADHGGSDASTADTHVLRAQLLLVQDELGEARTAVDTALELQPSHAPALALRRTMDECAAVYATEATKLALLGLASDAAINLEHARELRPADPTLLVSLAMAFRQQGKLHQAAEVRLACLASLSVSWARDSATAARATARSPATPLAGMPKPAAPAPHPPRTPTHTPGRYA
jgi:tetratricopeptide (TPR) repeat protein